MVYLVGSFDSSNDVNIELSLIRYLLVLYEGTSICYSDGLFDGTKYLMLKESILGVPLGCTDGLVIGFGEGIILISTYGEVLGYADISSCGFIFGIY